MLRSEISRQQILRMLSPDNPQSKVLLFCLNWRLSSEIVMRKRSLGFELRINDIYFKTKKVIDQKGSSTTCHHIFSTLPMDLSSQRFCAWC
jgi:hypothetical protein